MATANIALYTLTVRFSFSSFEKVYTHEIDHSLGY